MLDLYQSRLSSTTDRHPGRAFILTFALIMALAVSGLACAPSDRTAETDEEYQRQLLRQNVDLYYGLMSIERYSPPRAARLFGYAYLALYEGWVHGLEGFSSLAGRLNGLDALPLPEEDATYDWGTVALTAQYEVAQHILEQAQLYNLHEIESFRDAHVERQLENGMSERVRARSETYGAALAEVLTAWADADGYHDTRMLAYSPVDEPGHWQPTADYGTSVALNAVTNIVQLFEEDDWREISERSDVRDAWLSDRMLVSNRPETITDPNIAMEPYWGTLRPFVLDSVQQVQPKDPIPYSEEPGSDFYQEAMAVYDAGREIDEFRFSTAYYWADLPGETGTPAGHWIKIAVKATEQNDIPFAESLHATALTALSVGDAFIACWYEKYRTDVVRPVTYIRAHIDPLWEPLIVTPPFPEYPAGHSTISFAAAQTLTELFGDLTFTDSTHTHRYGFEPRTYESFLEASGEAALSRLYGGIHFPMGIEYGNIQGIDIGKFVAERLGTGE